MSTVDVLSYSTGGVFFNIGTQTYLVLSTITYNGDLTPTASYLAFYFVDHGRLTPVGSLIPQPQLVVVNALPSPYQLGDRSVKVLVTCNLTLNPGQLTTFDLTQTTSPNNTFILGDNRNLRVYDFDGVAASLVYGQQIDTYLGFTAWYPNAKLFAVALSAGFTNLVTLLTRIGAAELIGNLPVLTTAPSVIQLFQLEQSNGYSVSPASIAIVAPPTPVIQFSANRQWMIVGGGGRANASMITTTNLYRVTDNQI